MTADDRDLAARQNRDTKALARALMFDPCPTCKGSAWTPIGVPGAADEWCRDCGGSGIDKIKARELGGGGRELLADPPPLPCTWGDDAWHRAVTRLLAEHRGDYQRLLTEERGKP